MGLQPEKTWVRFLLGLNLVDSKNWAIWYFMYMYLSFCMLDRVKSFVYFLFFSQVQLTDFENAAYVVFLVLMTRVILTFQLNFIIPLSKVSSINRFWKLLYYK